MRAIQICLRPKGYGAASLHTHTPFFFLSPQTSPARKKRPADHFLHPRAGSLELREALNPPGSLRGKAWGEPGRGKPGCSPLRPGGRRAGRGEHAGSARKGPAGPLGIQRGAAAAAPAQPSPETRRTRRPWSSSPHRR